jgi:hypothetical protein
VSVCGTEVGLATMPVALGYLPRHLLLLFPSFGKTIMYIFTYTHTHIRILENFMPLHPYAHMPQLQ